MKCHWEKQRGCWTLVHAVFFYLCLETVAFYFWGYCRCMHIGNYTPWAYYFYYPGGKNRVYFYLFFMSSTAVFFGGYLLLSLYRGSKRMFSVNVDIRRQLIFVLFEALFVIMLLWVLASPFAEETVQRLTAWQL